MSYILDALVKSEQARLQGSAAARHSLLPAVGEALPPRRVWHYLLLTGLLGLNAAVLYPRLRSAPPPEPVKAPQPSARPGVAPALAATAPIPRRTPVLSPPLSPPAQPRVAASKEPPPAAEAPPLLPPLAVAGYIRNPGAPDMVIVNDKLLREGDEVEPGLRLEKILGDGLVFDFKGYRFKR